MAHCSDVEEMGFFMDRGDVERRCALTKEEFLVCSAHLCMTKVISSS